MTSSSNSEFETIYDIFLSFRGLDTRKKFTDHLYEALKREGFRTFRDNEEIPKGEIIKSELQKAMMNTRMSVVVLSKNYANSTACLFEIKMILDRRKTSDHFVLPVFYEVDPLEIKQQAKNLDFGEKKPTEEEVKGWRAALEEVARMAGMVSENKCNGYEAKFIQEIIGVVKSKLAGKHQRIYDHLEHEKNMQNLQRKTKYLSAQENDMNKQISCAKFRPLKRRKAEVKVRLRDVQVLKDDVQRLKDNVQRFEQVFGERNFFSHVRLGERIIKTIQEVEELHKKGKAFNGLVVEEIPSGRLLMPPTKDFVESTEARNVERVWECLMNDEDRWIGVSGMGGVGKTTIMKHIHNRLLEETDKFDSVFWLTVSNSKPFNVIRLQKDMAKVLKLNLSDKKNETKSASELYYLLSQRKKYVLILDDVWEAFHLERVGIPEPTKSNGCKLVLTTRSLEVCRKMECRIVKVGLLTEQEALELFMRKGIGRDIILGAKDTEIATEIAKRCARLPLAIVTVATSMRGLNSTREWKNALNEFTNLMDEDSSGENEVFEQLKFSYSRLGDKAVQDCFLYCSLYPEDFEIFVEELIELWIAEGLIHEMNSVQAMVDKCHSILEKLKSTCLLEATIVDGSECVRMHDLIRDMALRITGGRYRYVEEDEEGLWSEDHEKISFMFKNVCPKRPPVCPRLTSLLFGWNDFYLIPESFFTNMHCLKVLDLSFNKIQSLPESISNLENLHALILTSCHQLEYVPSMKKLKALKEFKLTESLIEGAPKGVEELVNLRKLDLSYNRKLDTFPSAMLRRLSKLQFLVIDGTRVELSAEDLMCLRQLKVVGVQFHNVQELTRYVTSQQFQWLEMYRLIVGKVHTELCHGLKYCTSYNRQVLINFASKAFGSGVHELVLPRDISFFELQGFHDLSSLSTIPSLKNARGLSECVVGSCERLESIFSSSSFSEDGRISLSSVSFLTLFDLPSCRVLFDGISPVHDISFNLTKLSITKCHSMKYILPSQLLQNLPNLKTLEVKSCESVEEIIVGEEEMRESHHRDGSNTITLPRLEDITLAFLPSLKSIHTGTIMCESLFLISVEDCPMLRRLPLSLDVDNKQATAPPSLEFILGDEKWWESLEWDDPRTKTILQHLLNRGKMQSEVKNHMCGVQIR